MWNIRAAVLSGVATMALAFNTYGSDSSFRAQSVLASLIFLEQQACMENYSPDQISNLEAHIKKVMQNIEGDEFSPINGKKMLDGNFGAWHKIPWLDNSCWAKEILYCLNCEFERRFDYGCGPAGEGRWCCAGIATCGVWPAMSIVLASLGGIAQGFICGGSIPCRFCEEVKEEPYVNVCLLRSFVQDKALELRVQVKERGIQLTPKEQTDLERLSRVLAH